MNIYCINTKFEAKLIVFFGNVIVKIVGGELTVIVPSCDSTIVFTLTKPNPVPCIFVVNSGSNILFIISLGISGPESCTSKMIDAAINLGIIKSN